MHELPHEPVISIGGGEVELPHEATFPIARESIAVSGTSGQLPHEPVFSIGGGEAGRDQHSSP